jgi:hypothetical protein
MFQATTRPPTEQSAPIDVEVLIPTDCVCIIPPIEAELAKFTDPQMDMSLPHFDFIATDIPEPHTCEPIMDAVLPIMTADNALHWCPDRSKSPMAETQLPSNMRELDEIPPLITVDFVMVIPFSNIPNPFTDTSERVLKAPDNDSPFCAQTNPLIDTKSPGFTCPNTDKLLPI